jgi:acylphosphatase
MSKKLGSGPEMNAEMNPEMTSVFRHYLISGQVQGVGFRRFVHRSAQGLGLKGQVRNLKDGRVEVYVEAAIKSGANAKAGANIEEFESLLAQGPSFSQVSGIEAHTLQTRLFVGQVGVQDDSQSFTVVEDGEAPWFAK